MAEKASEVIEEAKKVEEQLRQAQLREEHAKEMEEKKTEEKTQELVGEAEKQAEEKKEERKEEKPPERKEEKKIVLERTLVVPLRKAYRKPRSHRARVALSLLKQFVARHAKTQMRKVSVVNEVNALVQAQGARHPPKRIRLRVQKFEDGVASVSLVK